MRARALFAGLAAISTVVIAGPASAKGVESITEANITGPGLEGGLRIEARDTEGLNRARFFGHVLDLVDHAATPAVAAR